MYAIGKNIISARAALNKITGRTDNKPDEAKIVEKINNSTKYKIYNVHGILVDGVTNPKLRLSNCCNPIPGDPIVGYVTKGMGITIHRETCPNVSKSIRERLINVSWSQSLTKHKYRVHLKVQTFNRNNIVVELINLVSAQDANIAKINTSLSKIGENVIKLGLDVQNIEHLDKILIKLRNVTDVFEVERVNK